MCFFLSQSCYTLLSYKSWAFNLVPWVSVQMNHPPWRWKMEDIVKKMQEIPCFQSLHHEEEDVVWSLQEILLIILQEYRHRFGENIHCKLLSAWLLLVHLKVIVATLALGSRPRLKGLQGCRPRGRKPGSQSKGIARVRAKRKPGS